MSQVIRPLLNFFPTNIASELRLHATFVLQMADEMALLLVTGLVTPRARESAILVLVVLATLISVMLENLVLYT